MEPKISNQRLKSSGVPTRKLLQLDVQILIKQLEQVGMLHRDQFQFIIQSSISVLKFQPNILRTNSPTIIVGDIHGQFYDLMTIFRKHGLPPKTKYVFLGDYVDRGEFSIEVITLLFWLKLKYPKSIYLLRGNHECRVLTNTHNFKNQCKSKYNLKIYELVIILFEVLPICCIVDGKYFCVHAGISPLVNSLEQIQKISRFCQIPQKGALCDLLWSDPTDDDKKQWTFNSMRSCSYYYSRQHALNFLKKNNLEMIIRGHQVQLEGYKYMQFKKSNKKNVLTVFSAPNYCDKYNNLGAVALIENNDIILDSFKFVEHPYILPNNMNIFQWSIGIISNQAVKILVELVKTRFLMAKQDSIDRIKERIQLFSKMDAIKRALQQGQQRSVIYKSPQVLTAKENNTPTITNHQQSTAKHAQNGHNKNNKDNIQLKQSTIKCLITILMFLCQKRKDQKDEAMPINQDIKNQAKNQQLSIYGQQIQKRKRNRTVKNTNSAKLTAMMNTDADIGLEKKMSVDNSTQENKQQGDKDKNNDEQIRIPDNSKIKESVMGDQLISLNEDIIDSTGSKIDIENSKQLCIFGPKIYNFAKITPKK